ncbi:MAG TPA: Ig-like domain-containing protein, partial [Acidobacteriota bacterium]|nr:Ig-like domain-containing protein [Acidobacteriota bacterium]
MNKTRRCAVTASILIILFSVAGFAQQDAKKNWYAASFDGTSGLFKAWDAETLKQWETNFTFGYDQLNRDPGQLRIGRLPVGVAVGITDRFEIFASMDVHKRINAGNIVPYALNLEVLQPLRPAGTPAQNPYFTQAAPFIGVNESSGRGDARFGVKLNFLSERKGNPLSMAISGFGTIPGHRANPGLRHGLSSGAYQGGFALLMSKTAGNVARLHFNVGNNFYGDPKGINVTLQNEFIYRGGAEFMPNRPYRLIAELSGIAYHGDRTAGLNPKNPMDLILGMRVYPAEWVSLGAGYQASFRHVDVMGADTHGFVVQGTFGSRRDHPPTIECALAKDTIIQGETTTIRAHASDRYGDDLTFTWKTTGGKISAVGNTATFDATGVAPGKYTVTATVQDRKHSVSCSSEITVLRRSVQPKVSVEPSTFSLLPGESVVLNCVVANVESKYLKYAWTVNGQKIAGETARITFG